MRSLPAREEQFPIIRMLDEYLCYMDESLQIDMLHMGKLVAHRIADAEKFAQAAKTLKPSIAENAKKKFLNTV